MGTLINTVDTVNAAASAIVNAESRIQPTTTVPKKRWGSCWSLYWCFGPHKNSKRISNAVLVPEPVEPIVPVGSHPATVAPNPSTAIVMPFIVPPSSPASFLQSDPPSATQSPVGLFSLSSLTVSASGGPSSIFAIGPYAYETQLVSPPVFSNFTTEPSTPFTPPPESLQLTTPSSPEVPFAQLLASSLDRDCKNNGTNQKFPLSNYEFQLYQQYPGSPGTQLISPGSIISTSGSSTPFPDRQLGSGSLTPDGMAPPARNDIYVGKQISVANSENECQPNAALVNHRVSFELTGEDVARCLANKSGSSLHGNMSGSSQGEEQCCRRHHSFNSSKEFNFDNRKGVVSDNPTNSSEWWTNKKIVGKEGRSSNSWAFFPMLQSEII
uniref:Uncharacterized protein At1g76660 family n=1 Tax=Cajanus cajan TaxID=3821 RepID=A0A151U612_CAJCA|nr:Uncharacterized protein At1g76660 family [Cajanus cajan]